MTSIAAPLRAGALSGVVPPLLTPLDADGELDVPSLERLIDHLIRGGVDGLFVLGSSGEVAFSDDAQRRRILDAVTGIVGGQVPLIVGAIDMETRRVQQHMRDLARYDLAGVVATAPFYAITGPAEIDAHFRAAAATAPAPLWAYDIPVCVHVKLAPEHLVRLAADGVIVGVKDSSGDDVSFRRLTAMNREAGTGLALLTGHEIVVDGAYLAGAHGCVPGLGNVDPAGYARMHAAAQRGDWESMRREQDRLAALFEIVFQAPGRVGPTAGVGAFKTALREMGIFSTNTMSAPMASLDDDETARIRTVLERAGLLGAHVA
ncbi:dihydrodipicolinate synthase family protein [Brachybacterium sp. EF45031]|uniref:dihydrodipicolinate synthase family protein n=1 Tax=Brachybacterium sillae TaxID=2810536 RepID=UPI00217CFD46|nr:dihydrodipicolinate synthase family protein [Brachybacterium sillae]MCS6711393.1 dihydrodipicolinate synthase family protein [Brachybacterium sillae]